MARSTGVTSGTAANLQIDAGVVTVGGVALGATRGGAQFTVERTIREPELDGQPSPVVGTMRVIRDRAVLTVNALEFTQANIDNAIIGSGGTPEEYLISAASHKTVTFVGKTAGGATATITLNNAICTTPGITMEDENEGAISMEFVACYTPGSDACPWSIVMS
jgi:hypothetical protein